MKVIWSAKGYIFVGLLCYVMTLLATMPLNMLWPQVKPYMQGLPVQVKSVSGTLWRGQGLVNVPQLGSLKASWQLSPLSLLMAKADLELKVTSAGLELASQVQVSVDTISLLKTSGTLDSHLLKPILKQNRTTLAGQFELTNFALEYNHKTPEVLSAQGRVLYSGGDISFPIDGNMISSTLPLIIGDIEKQENKLILDLNTEEQAALGQGFFEPEGGWAGISIKRRFIDILGQKWPAQAAEDDVIFEVSEKVM